MKTWEAIKALEEGKKVRKRDWNKNWYVFMNEDGDYIDECDCVYGFDHKCEDWELYEEKEIKTISDIDCQYFIDFINKISDKTYMKKEYVIAIIEQILKEGKEVNEETVLIYIGDIYFANAQLRN